MSGTGVDPNLLTFQGASGKFHEAVVDWITGTCARRFAASTETLALAVNLFDRYSCKMVMNKVDLLPVAACCTWIAAKFEEIYPPELDTFIFWCGGKIERTKMLQFERHIVQTLEFQLVTVYPHQFAERFIAALPLEHYEADWRKHQEMRKVLMNYALYIIEWSYQHDMFIGTLPSRLAAAAVVLALTFTGFCGPNIYPDTMQHLCGHSFQWIWWAANPLWNTLWIGEQNHKAKAAGHHTTKVYDSTCQKFAPLSLTLPRYTAAAADEVRANYAALQQQ